MLEIDIETGGPATPKNELLTALEDMLAYGVEMDDARIPYITVQIDRDVIANAKEVVARAKERGRQKVSSPQPQEAYMKALSDDRNWGVTYITETRWEEQ